MGPSIAGIIVLGGGADQQAIGSPQIAGLNEAAERYTEAVALARRLPEARLVFAGGSGGLITADAPEAETAARLFEALGIARDRITLEADSRDTYENALFTARMLKPRPDQRWLLFIASPVDRRHVEPGLALWPGQGGGAWLEVVNDDLSPCLQPEFSPDGRFLAWGSLSGTVTLVDLPLLQRGVAVFEQALQAAPR